jgi:cephalosporin hydroxylase
MADYKDILRTVHEVLAPERYLEIGVRHGASLALASCRSVGVDPCPEISISLGPDTTVVELTSDAFFESRAADVLASPPDLVFIDGRHTFENVLRDFMHLERLAAPATLVVIDDVYPNHPRQADRDRSTQVWMGDVWKIQACLAEQRPDLLLLPVDARPGGLLLVAGLDATNRILWQQYNSIVRHFNDASRDRPPASVLHREGAVSAFDPRVRALLDLLRDQRVRGATRAQIGAAIAGLQGAVPPADS